MPMSDSYKGWKLPETLTVSGQEYARHYDTKKSAAEYLRERELPSIENVLEYGKITPENWAEYREKLLDIVCEYSFGYPPAAPTEVRSEIVYSSESAPYADILKTCAGKAVSERIHLTFDAPYGTVTLPMQLVRPVYGAEKPPVFLYIGFHPSLWELPLKSELEINYLPLEEIIDNGFAVAMFCYNDAVGDNPKGIFDTGIGRGYFNGEPRTLTQAGKVTMWAYAASRCMDYLCSRDDLDASCVSVAGHSRLGKTALWTAALDDRFFAACVNGSGFGGAGLMRGVFDSRLKVLTGNGNIDWWDEKIRAYIGRETELPFDAHFMLAAIAPRYVCLGCADGDYPLYQLQEYLSAAAASPAFEALGLYGLIAPDTPPRPYASFLNGHIGYFLRPGSHYFSRWDWNNYMEFIRRHRK